MVNYQGNAPVANNNYGIANGANSTSPLLTILMTRNPTSNDVNYQVKQRWINTSAHSEWILTSFTQSNNTTVANWMQLSDGDALTQIGVPNGTSPIAPDANGLVNFTSTGGSVTMTGSSGGTGAQNINFDIQNYGTSTTLFVPNLQINGSSTGITYSTQLGGYTVLTNIVFIWVHIVLTSKGASSGLVTLSNLPFATHSNGAHQSISISSFNNVTGAGYTCLSLDLANSSTVGTFLLSSASGSAQALLLDTNISNTTSLKFNGFYILD